jgi:hypothetical protein
MSDELPPDLLRELRGDPTPEETAELVRIVADRWDAAQRHWTHFLLLSEPINDSNQPSVAQIHLGTRQVALHFGRIVERKLHDCVEAMLAHEIGHHVRYPGSLAVQARLRLLEQALIPLENYSFINLFTDFLINAHLGPKLKDQLVRIYQAFDPHEGWKNDPAFLFYLAAYEELWRLPAGTLMNDVVNEFDRCFPNYRAEAQLLGQNVFGLGPNLYTQFVYFLSVLSRYVKPIHDGDPESIDPYRCGAGTPSPEDWADALVPTAREQEAIRRAIEEGWITGDQQRRLKDGQYLDRRIAGLPGHGTRNAETVPEVMAAYYRQQAERYLLKPPSQRTLGEAVVPTSMEEWEPGDPIRDIDWLQTLLERGELLGSAQPLKRIRIAEYEGHDVPLWQPRIEIYLDVSGSMPDPRMTRNAMTLAALVLAMGAIRAGGWARALIYSHAHVSYWKWCRSELELSRFLMHYVGGGTEFPFTILQESVQECGMVQPTRVVISDRDFDSNYGQAPYRAAIFAEAARRSVPLILLQHLAVPERVKVYEAAGAKVIPILQMEDYPRMAGALARALFDEGGERSEPRA